MVYGAILAGGRSARMGADKAEVMLAGRSLVSHVATRLAPQVERLALVGGAPTPEITAVLLQDARPKATSGGQGPLAGILSALEWAKAEGASQLVVSAVDTPFLPRDLVIKLTPHLVNAQIAFAKYGDRTHYLASAWRTDLAPALRDHLMKTEDLSIRNFAAKQLVVKVAFESPGQTALDPFLNLNTPEDLLHADQLAKTIDEL